MKTNKITITDFSHTALSNADGIAVYTAVNNLLADGYTVVISFSGINALSTSFLNSFIGSLVDQHGFNILTRIKIVDYTVSIANFLKNYIAELKLVSSTLPE
jgi:hypothetical protein